MIIKITNKYHSLYGLTYNVEKEDIESYHIRLKMGVIIRVFKTDCKVIATQNKKEETK